jgi:GAF domain-containing protein
MTFGHDDSTILALAAKLVAAASSRGAHPAVEEALTAVKDLETVELRRDDELARGSVDYARGARDLSLEFLRNVRAQALPEVAKALGERHRELLRQVHVRPGITKSELGEALDSLRRRHPDDAPGSGSLALGTWLDDLYSANIIEPAPTSDSTRKRSPANDDEFGLRLTRLGEEIFKTIAPLLVIDPPLAPESVAPASAPNFGSETVQKLDQVLRQYDQLEAVTRALFDLGRIAPELCRAIDCRFGFDFSAVQIVRSAENAIETIAGSGIAAQWVGHAKHRLEDDPMLRDIQADIVKERIVEVIIGDDPRLDKFIQRTFQHKNLARVFVPLVVVRDGDGNIVANPQVWQPALRKLPASGKGKEVLKLVVGEGLCVEVIGSVEAGFEPLGDERARDLSLPTATAVADFVTARAGIVYKSLLGGVLEQVAEMARSLASADIATVQWGISGDGGVRHWDTVGVGPDAQTLMTVKNAPRGAIGGRPRSDGLGLRALTDGQPRTAGRDLDLTNPHMYKQGIRATAVFPSTTLHATSEGEKLCLIYTHYRKEREFPPEELKWVQHLARRSGYLLRMASELSESRDHERKLAAMHQVAQAFSERGRWKTLRELMEEIAGRTLNLCGADIVSIYQCDPQRRGLLIPPVRAGRLASNAPIDQNLEASDAPLIVLHKGLRFASIAPRDPTLDPHAHPNGFVTREKIASAAGLQLIADNEPVGVMFVNYRETHHFTDKEKAQLQQLAALSATALKNFGTGIQLVEEPQLEQLVATSLN